MVVGQSPQNFDHAQSRWTLRALRQTLKGFEHYSLSGLWLVLLSLGIRHLRARLYVHSPDKQYEEKLHYLQQAIRSYDPQQHELYFLDQLTVYLHPSIGYDWSNSSEQQPLARQGYRSNNTVRICAALHCFTGQVAWMIRSKISLPSLVQFFTDLAQKHPGKTVFIVLDNWPLHWHPDLRAALQPQQYPFQGKLPKAWQQLIPTKKFVAKNLPIQLLYLPTYASWLNPIEKLWRWLKQDIIHNHRLTDDFQALKTRMTDWFANPTFSPQQILQYVGLNAPTGNFAQALKDANTRISKNV